MTRRVFAGVIPGAHRAGAALLLEALRASRRTRVQGGRALEAWHLCAIGLFMSGDGAPLFLQIKEAEIRARVPRAEIRGPGPAGRRRSKRHAGSSEYSGVGTER